MNVSKSRVGNIGVFVAVLGMGSLYFQVLRMPLMALMMVSVSVVLIYLNGFEISKYNFSFFMILSAALLLTSFINSQNGFRINDIVIWFANIIFIIALAESMSFDDFMKRYTSIMIFEAVISLICFTWGDIFGNALPFLKFESNSANGYYLAPYYTLGWKNIPVFGRNAGIFNEPGSHQIFLNFALLFLLSSENKMNKKSTSFIISVAVLVITILTTMSTTGYICFAIVLLAVSFKKSNSSSYRKTSIKILAFIMLLILYFVEQQTGIIETKIVGREQGGSFYTRYNDSMGGYSVALNNPFFGIGMFAENKSDILSQYEISHISNGMAAFAMSVGLIIVIIWLLVMLKNIARKLPYGTLYEISVFILYLLCVNSEGVFTNLLFLSFFAAWKESNNELNVSS